MKTLVFALLLLIPTVALAAPSGTIHLPFSGQSFDNNLIVSATVDDPDGIGVAIMRFNGGASITLCNGCGTGGRYTQSGIFPGSLGMGPGSQSAELLVGPSTSDLTVVAVTSFTWNPRVISGIDVVRTVGNIEISWAPTSGIARYNVYLASEQNISPQNINSLQDSQAIYGIAGSSASFTVTDDELGMFALVTGSDASGESAFSSVFRIEAFDNQDPTIGEDVFELDEDTSASGNVLENDTDPEGDDLTAELVEQPLNGTVELSEDGTFTYTPNANFNGTDSFIYNALDSLDGVGIGTVQLTILPISDPPVANDDNFETPEDTNLTIDVLNGLLANDADVDAGDELVVLSPGEISVSIGDLSVSSDGSFSYSPPAEFSGEVQFDYTVSDVNGDTDTATATIVVTPLNDAPIANDDSYAATTENLLAIDATLGVLANDTDTNLAGEDSSASLSATVLTTTTNGTLTLNSDGSFTYQADTGFSGEDSFTYQAADEAGLSADATVTIAVTQNATAPVANDDSYETDEATTLSVDAANGVLANDTNLTNSGVDSTIVTVNLVSEPTGGTLVLNGDGSFTYTPNGDTTGSDSFTYELQKIPGGTDTATVTITLNPVATPPVANDDSYTTDRGITLTVDAANGLMANDTNLTDTGFDDTTVSVAISTEPANGIVLIAEDGSFSYTPTDGFAGTDTFTYQLTKTPGGTDTATVTITVNNVNNAPIATDDSYTLNEDVPLVVSATDGVLNNDSDVDGDSLTVTLVTEPESGTLQLSEDGAFSYTPNADFFGSDTFTYELSDGGADTSQAQVSLTVSPVNDAPLANDDSYTTNEDEVLTISDATIGLLANDSDADLTGDARYTGLSVSLLQAPDSGELSLQANGIFTYTPLLNFFGEVSFTYQISDSAGETASASVTISVVDAQDLPIAVDDAYTVDEDVTLTVSAAEGLLANDSDPEGQALNVTSIITQPTNGVVSFNSDGSFSYTPNSDFNGDDSFVYQVSDSAGGTANGTVAITVSPINDAPVAVDDTVNVEESGTQTLTPLDNDTDIDGDTLTIVSATAVSGQLTFTGTQINYTAPDTDGTDTITYTINDALGLAATASIAITVTGVNDAPVANPDTATTDEDTTVSIDVLANDTDEDGDALTISSATTTSGTVSINGAQLSYTPAANFNGTATITYDITDPSNATSSASVTVTVTPVNDAPAAEPDTASTNEDTAVSIFPLSNDSDVDGDTLIISLVSAVTGTANLISETEISYTPEENFNGSVDLTYLASDQNGGTNTGTITVSVSAVNDLPIATSDSAAALQGETISITPLDNDTDVDGDTLTITSAVASTGTVSIDSSATSLSFTAQTDSTNDATIDYEVSDGNGGTATSSVTVTVTDTNIAPVANADNAEVFAGESVDILPLSNDTDADGDTLSVTAASTDVGTVSISTDATTITYTAPSDTSATATISYTVADPTGATDSSTISVSISEQTLTGDFDPDGDGTSDVSAVTSGSDYVLSFGNDVESVYYLEDGETVSVTANDSGSFEITVGSTATVNRLVPLKKNGTGVWVQDDFRIDGANTVEIFYTVNGIEYSFTITNLDQPNANIAFGPPTTLSSDFSGNNSFEFYTKYKPFAGALRTGVENGMYYDLDSSGNGRYGDSESPSEVMWSIVNGVIYVDFVSAPEDSEFRSVYDLDDDNSDGIAMGVITRAEADAYVSATGSSFVETFVSAYQDRITLTKNNRVSKEVNIERFYGYRIDSSANPTITSAQTPQVSAITENNLQLLLNLDDLKRRPITTNILLSSEVVLDVPRFDSTFTFEEFSAESCTFSQTSTIPQTNVTLIFGSANCTDGSSFDWTLEEGTTNPRFYSSYANGDITVEYFWLDQLAIENTFAVKVQDVRNANSIYQIKHYTTLGYWMPLANQPSDADITGLIGNGYLESSYLLTAPDAYDSTRNLSDTSANGVYFDYSGTGSSGFAKSIYGYTNVHGEPFIDDIDRHWQLSMGLLELESRTNILSNDDFRYVTSQCVDMQNQDCFVWQKQSLRVLAISGSRIWVAESEEQNEQSINFGSGINYVTTRPSAIHYYQSRTSVPGAPNSLSFNQEPVTDFFQLETELDTTLSNINVLTYASDPEGDSLSVVNATAFNGTASVNPDNTINYIPNTGYIGNDGLYYDISDGINTRTFYVQVTVRGQNVAPVAVDDTATAFSGLETIISPLANDTDTNNDSLILTAVSSDVGTAAIDTSDNTQFSFRSGTTFSGNAVVTYTVSDQRGGTDTGTVTISVSPASISGSYDLDNSGQSDFNIIANGNLYDVTFSSDVSAAYVILNGQRYPLARSNDGSFKFVIDPSDTVQPEIFYVINGVSYSFTPQNLSTSPAIGFGVATALSNDFGLASSYNLITRSPVANASLSTAFENGEQYILNSGGTGTYSSVNLFDTITWSALNGTITVRFDNPVESTVYYNVYSLDDEDNGDGALGLITKAEADAYVANNNTTVIDVQISTLRHELTGIQNNAYFFNTNQNVIEQFRIDNTQHPEITSTQAISGMEFDVLFNQIDLMSTDAFDFLPFTYDAISSGVFIPVAREDGSGSFTEFAYDYCTYSETNAGDNSGSGSCVISGESFTWSINTTTGALSAVFSNNVTLTYNWFTESNIESTVLVSATDNQSKTYTTLDFWMSQQSISASDVTNLLSGFYFENSKNITNEFNYDQTGILRDDIGEGFYFDNAGMAKELRTVYFSDNNFGTTDSDFFWDVDTNGIVQISARSNISSSDTFRYFNSQCTDSADAQCFTWLIRQWETVAIENNRIWVLETEVRNTNYSYWSGTLTYVENLVPKLHFYELRTPTPGAPNSISFNQDPIIDYQTTSTPQDTAINIDLLAFASDPEGDTLTVTFVETETGTVTSNGDGTVTFTPDTGYNGLNRISFDVSDGINTVYGNHDVTVGTFNTEPQAFDDTEYAFGGHSHRYEVTFNDYDSDGDRLTITSIFGAVSASISADRTAINYDAPASTSATETVEYEISDGNGGSDFAVLTINLVPNNAPVAVDDVPSNSVTSGSTITLFPLDNDSDVDGHFLVIDQATSSDGVISVYPDGQSIDFTPSITSGTATISYSVSDGVATSNTATITVTVNSNNSAPIANDDNYSVAPSSVNVFSVLDNDYDSDTDPITIVSTSTNATRSSDDLFINYTAPASGTSDTITYTIDDGNGGQDSATVFVTLDYPPTAVNDSETVQVGASTTLFPLINDSDPEGIGTVTITSLGYTGSGSAIIGSDTISIDYTAPTSSGSDTVTYTITDAVGNTASATITITVTVANNPPVANTDSYTILSDGSTATIDLSAGVLINDTDSDGNTLTASIVSGPAQSSAFTLNADGSFSYQHNGGTATVDSFTYNVSDGITSSTGTVNLSIQKDNFAPEICTIPKLYARQGEQYNLRVSVSDLDHSSFNFDDSGKPTWFDASVTSSNDIQLLGTPSASDVGSHSVSITASDGIDFSTLSYNLTVVPEFGAAGSSIVNFGGTTETVHAAAIDNFGNIVIVGESDNDFAVAKVDASGTLDAGFGTNGVATFNLGSGTDTAKQVLILPNNGILVVGESDNGSGSDLAVIALTETGTLDTNFDSDGIYTLDPFGGSNIDTVTDAIVFNNNKIVISGFSFVGAVYEGFLVQLNADGSIDTGFDTDGIWSINNSPYDLKLNSLLKDNEGFLYAAGMIGGATNDNGLLVRLMAGAVDTNFNTTGLFSFDLGGNEEVSSTTFDRSGNIIAVGKKDSFISASRITISSSGNTDTPSIDGTFETNFTTPASSINGGVVPNGEVQNLLSDHRGNFYLTYVDGAASYGVRISPNGNLDSTYATNGIKTVPLSSGVSNTPTVAVLDAFGQLLYIDTQNPSANDEIVLTYDYILDSPDFGSCDTASEFVGTSSKTIDFVSDAAKATDNDYFVVGWSQALDDSNKDLAVMKTDIDGHLDASWGNAGVSRIDVGESIDSADQQAIALSNNEVVLATNDAASSDVILVKFNDLGELDTGFGASGIMDLTGTITMAIVDNAHDSSTNSFYLLGEDSSGFARIYRFNGDGTFDTTFGIGTGTTADAGVNYTLVSDANFSPKSMIVRSSGEIALVGSFYDTSTSYNKLAVVLMDNSGVINYTGSWLITVDDGQAISGVSADTDGSNIFVLAKNNSSVARVYKFNNSTGLDPSFYGSGQTELSNYRVTDGVESLKLDSTGQLWISVSDASSNKFMLRLTTTGDFDPSFINAGQVELSHGISTWSSGAGVAGFELSSNDNAFIYGHSNQDFILAKMNSTGVIENPVDLTQFDFGFGENALDIELDAYSSPILAGSSYNTTLFDNDFAMTRFDNAGNGDNSFGDSGVGANVAGSIGTQDFNALVGVGAATQDICTTLNLSDSGHNYVSGIWQLTTDDNSDVAFTRTNNATASLDADPPYSLSDYDLTGSSLPDQANDSYLADDGSQFVVGQSGGQAYILKLLHGGGLDTSFGTSGVLNPIASSESSFNAITVAQDGDLLVAGYAIDSVYGKGIIAKISKDGVLDSTFGNMGVVEENGGENIEFRDIVISANAEIFVVGRSFDFSLNSGNSFIASYTNSGTLNSTFDSDGLMTQNLSTDELIESFVDVELDAFGALVLLAQIGNEFAIYRMSDSGAALSSPVGNFSYGAITKMRDMEIDSLGNIYVTGAVQYQHQWQFFVVRFPNAIGPY